MKIFSLALCLLSVSILASAPMKPFVEKKGDDLKITFINPTEIQFVGWTGQKFKTVPNQQNFSLKRRGLNSLPTELLIIPKSSKKGSILMTIPKTQRKITIGGKKGTPFPEVPKNEIWLWGQTPPDPCSNKSRPWSASHIKIFTKKRSTTLNFSGAFLVKIKPEFPPLYIASAYNHIVKAAIEGFIPADIVEKNICKSYYGGNCDVLLTPQDGVTGKNIMLKFSPVRKGPAGCPI